MPYAKFRDYDVLLKASIPTLYRLLRGAVQRGAITRDEFEDLAEQSYDMGRKERRMHLVKVVYKSQKYCSRRPDLSAATEAMEKAIYDDHNVARFDPSAIIGPLQETFQTIVFQRFKEGVKEFQVYVNDEIKAAKRTMAERTAKAMEAAIEKRVKEAMRPIHARLREVEKRTIRKRPAAILKRPAACVMKRPAGYAVAYRGPAAAMP